MTSICPPFLQGDKCFGLMTNNMIPKYNILVNGKHVEFNVLGWKTALAHAKQHTSNLFEINKVEILTLGTGEIQEIT